MNLNETLNVPLTREANPEETATLYQKTIGRLNEALNRLGPLLPAMTGTTPPETLADIRTVFGVASKLAQDIPGLLTQIGLLNGIIETQDGTIEVVQQKLAKALLDIDRLSYTGPVDPQVLLGQRGFKFQGGNWHPPSATHQLMEDEEKAVRFLKSKGHGDLERP